MRIVLGTRGSELALTQSGLVADALRALGHDVELKTVRTHGDVTTGSLVSLGGTGVFAAALRGALLTREVDIAVHSLKDLPTDGVPGLVLGAIPEREDPHDVLCASGGRRLADLPEGARIGTGSPRRSAQLKEIRPDLQLVEIRGNVGTRLARALGGGQSPADLDAVVLAAAGLHRLGREDVVTDTLDILPAAAQGALAVECREDRADLRDALAALDHAETRAAVTIERAVLAALGAGCAAPVAALAEVHEGRVRVRAKVLSPTGEGAVTASFEGAVGDRPELVGQGVASTLLRQDCDRLGPLDASRPSRLEEFHDDRELWAPGTTTHLVGRRVLLPRDDGPLAEALRDAGAVVDAIPLTRTVPVECPRLPREADWLVVTSPTAVRVLLERGDHPRDLGAEVAAVGPATRRALEEAGVRVALTPDGSSNAEALAAAFPAGRGRILIPGSALSRPLLARRLRAKGWQVDAVAIYTTEPLARAPEGLPEAWRRGDYDAVAVTAGSAARALIALLGPPPARTRVVAFGTPSAAVAAERGLDVDAVAPTQDGPGLLTALSTALGKEL